MLTAHTPESYHLYSNLPHVLIIMFWWRFSSDGSRHYTETLPQVQEMNYTYRDAIWGELPKLVRKLSLNHDDSLLIKEEFTPLRCCEERERERESSHSILQHQSRVNGIECKRPLLLLFTTVCSIWNWDQGLLHNTIMLSLQKLLQTEVGDCNNVYQQITCMCINRSLVLFFWCHVYILLFPPSCLYHCPLITTRP